MGFKTGRFYSPDVSKSPVLLFLLGDPWWFELGSHPGHPFIHSRALKTCSSPPQSVPQLPSSLPVMEACKRGDTLGDTGWLTEEEEGKMRREGADRCLNLSPGADEINPSSKAQTETESEIERWKQWVLVGCFPLCIPDIRMLLFLYVLFCQG